MNEAIPQLATFDESALDAAFSTLTEQVRTESDSLEDVDTFRLHSLGPKQLRLNLISPSLRNASPPELHHPLHTLTHHPRAHVLSPLQTHQTPQIPSTHTAHRLVLRTPTSPDQISTRIEDAPPNPIVSPGKVHRTDAADATHSPIFHQVEGLCVDTN